MLLRGVGWLTRLVGVLAAAGKARQRLSADWCCCVTLVWLRECVVTVCGVDVMALSVSQQQHQGCARQGATMQTHSARLGKTEVAGMCGRVAASRVRSGSPYTSLVAAIYGVSPVCE